MTYDDLIEILNVKKGEKIWLSSELVKLALLFKQNGFRFDVEELLNKFLNAIGEEGTLLIPTFSYEFSNQGTYDYKYTRGTAGALGNIALKRNDFKRTLHPIHSFTVWGKDQGLLVSMNNRHSFGDDSPFEYCKENNVRQIILGTDYEHAFTFVHFCESICDVPYRFTKTFSGSYINGDGIMEERTYDYAARDRSIKTINKFNNIGKILEGKRISEKIDFNGYECYSIDLAQSYEIICDDILNNKCRNIYDFNVSRDELFKEFPRRND